MDPLSFLFEELPWARPLVAWLLGMLVIFLLWLLVTFPAYLLHPFLQRTRLIVKNFSDQISTSYFAIWQGCGKKAALRFESFFKGHTFRYLQDRNREFWQLAVKKIVDPVTDLTTAFNNTSRGLDQAIGQLSSAVEQVKAIDIHFPSLPTLPTIEGLTDDAAMVRRERVNLIIGGAILTAIIVVNTGMLSQILKDTFEVVAIKVLGEIRLYHVLAALLTLVEGGVGYLYGRLSSESDAASERSYVARVIVVSFSVALAFIEGLFYSRVGSEEQRFHIPFADVTFTMQQAFFLWGFILPLMLFGLGHQCYLSIDRLSGGRLSARLRRDLKKSSELTDRLGRGVLNVGAGLSQVQEESTAAQAGLPLYSETQATRLVETLKGTVTALETIRKSTPEWAAKVTESVTVAEQHQQAFRTGALLGVTVIACAFSLWLQAQIIPGLYPAVSSEMALAIALVDSAALLGAGLLLRSRPTVVDEEGAFRVIEGRGALVKRGIAGAMVAFLLGAGFLVLWSEAIGSGYGLAWAVVLGISIGLVALGAELPSMIALAYSSVGAGIALAEGVGAAVAAWLVRGLVALLLLVEFVVGLLAVPAQWIAARRST